MRCHIWRRDAREDLRRQVDAAKVEYRWRSFHGGSPNLSHGTSGSHIVIVCRRLAKCKLRLTFRKSDLIRLRLSFAYFVFSRGDQCINLTEHG
jgi:hypothetical protein